MPAPPTLRSTHGRRVHLTDCTSWPRTGEPLAQLEEELRRTGRTPRPAAVAAAGVVRAYERLIHATPEEREAVVAALLAAEGEAESC